MARLNEVPAPAAESVEALKRRFIRQNREIARVNSTQSMRIRNLETEISRLLTENISLREDAINARAEAEKWRASHRLNKEVIRMKEQLELKLSEVSALVGELGALPEKVARRSSQRRRHGGLMSEMTKPNEEKEPRQRQTMLEQEGRLPAILEDKHYPRRTLEVMEIRKLVDEDNNEATESPDLGPPPIAHFDEPESVVFNPSRSPRRTSTELIEESEGIDRPSTMHTENRRKRRTSGLLQPSTIDNIVTEIPADAKPRASEPVKTDAPVAPRPILKTGAKRKLEASELEDTSRVSKELDDFIFQRKANTTPVAGVKQSRFSRPPGRQNQENAVSIDEKSPERPMQTSRKILAPKSTNSPAKRRIVASTDKSDNARDAVAERRPERRIVSRIRTKPESIDLMGVNDDFREREGDVQSIDSQARLDPKTPAPTDDGILSPISMEPSTKQRVPKEMAITNSVEDVLNGSIGRGTRRVRAPINYAQPNLRDKMRRPGKELVGAVEGLTKIQADLEQERLETRNGNTGLESARQDREAQVTAQLQLTSQETEAEHHKQWQQMGSNGQKSEPASPLRGKIAPTSRIESRESQGSNEGLNEAVSRLSVFDPLGSSPAIDRADEAIQHKPAVLTSRRHTTLSRHPDEPVTKISQPTERSRRPSSALGIREQQRQDNTNEDQQKRGHTRKAASVTALPSVSQLNKKTGLTTTMAREIMKPEPPPIEVEEILEARTRSSALTRRKSMMV